MSARVARAHEVVVVGGGQAGLAMGRQLARQGRDFTILEADKAPAAAWRERWDSLRLFTPARYSSLPGRSSCCSGGRSDLTRAFTASRR